MSAIASFFTALISPVTEIVKGKQQIKKAITDAKIAKVNNGQMSDIDMDKESRGLAGWMDDISFYGVYAIFIMAFFPDTQPQIQAGFKVIEDMPMFIQGAMGLMLIRIWGFSRLLGPIVSMIVKSSVLGRKT